MKRTRLTVGVMTVALAAWLLGCGNSNNSNSPTSLTPASPSATTAGTAGTAAAVPTGTFDLKFEQEQLPAGVDQVSMVFQDSQGNTLFGPVQQPISTDVQVTGVPINAVQVVIDYLQDDGLALDESTNSISFANTAANSTNPGNVGLRGLARNILAQALGDTAQVVNPTVDTVKPDRTVWTTSVNNGQAQIQVAIQGKPGDHTGPLAAPSPFTIKGVGYSPASIGNSNKSNPNFGDYFFDGGAFDSSKNFGGQNLLDWSKVWGRDLETLRGTFNALRIYSMVQLQVPDTGIPADLDTLPQFQHKNFLDHCWNDGDRPLFVLVGIPLPSTVMTLSGNQGNPSDAAFWTENFKRTVTQLKDHPAVIGFTIFNEQGGTSEWGGNAQAAQFYWQQIQTLTQFVKTTAPDKLVGFAYFDAPSDVSLATQNNLIQQFGGSLDFFGVNSFQSTTVTATLAPYTQLGAASKPVIFTEFGLPGTTHSDPSVQSDGKTPTMSGALSIVATDSSIATTTQALQFILPVALQQQIVAGMFYFEWNDEWWKQDPLVGSDATINTLPTRQEGGLKTGSPFPNLFNDEEGYGLNSIALNNRAATATYDPFNTGAATANNQPDILTPHQPMLDAVKAAFSPVR